MSSVKQRRAQAVVDRLLARGERIALVRNEHSQECELFFYPSWDAASLSSVATAIYYGNLRPAGETVLGDVPVEFWGA